MNSTANAYKKNQINTASSENLVLMLYDGARKYINWAIKSLENNNLAEANYNLIRSQDIMAELMSGINFEAGELAQKLFDVYEYMHFRLIQANLKKDPQAAQEVLGMIEELRNVWAQILKNSHSPVTINSGLQKMRSN